MIKLRKLRKKKATEAAAGDGVDGYDSDAWTGQQAQEIRANDDKDEDDLKQRSSTLENQKAKEKSRSDKMTKKREVYTMIQNILQGLLALTLAIFPDPTNIYLHTIYLASAWWADGAILIAGGGSAWFKPPPYPAAEAAEWFWIGVLL